MALVENARCKIEKLNSKGFGEGETEKGRVALPYLLPGDIVEFERHAYRGKSNCLIKSYEKGTHPRSDPPCEYFEKCGGCLLQHLTDEDYNNIKLSMITSPLDSYKIDQYRLNEIVTIPYGNRRRANIEAVKRRDAFYFGFHEHNSFRISDIDACIALDADLSRLLIPLKKVIEDILEERQKAQIFITKAANGVDLWLEIQNVKELEQGKRDLLKQFAISNNLIRLIFRHRKFKDEIYLQHKPYVVFDDVKVEVDAKCFLQSSLLSDKILGELVMNYVGTSGANVADLFCGRGTYTIPISKYSKVEGFESDKDALTSLGRAIETTERDVELFRSDLYSMPLKALELQKYDFCVINPPRSGAKEQIEELAKVKSLKICYVSCNPETFARDANILIDNGYVLREVTPVDQFYWASHVELVAYLEKPF